MKRLLTLILTLGVSSASADLARAVNLLSNGSLDSPGPGPIIDNWTLDMSKTFSGDTTDLITLEPWIEVGPITNGGGDLDLGGFLKAFQGNATTGDLATLHMHQGVPGLPGVPYILTGWIGAGANYSGLLAGPTKTELAIEFDNDNNRGNGFISTSVLDVKAAGLTSGGCCDFGAKEFSVAGTAPVGTTIVRARLSMIDAHNTMNPDPSAFIDDFNLSVVPEPASVALGLIGMLGMFGLVRRR